MSIASEFAREYQIKSEIEKTAADSLKAHAVMKPMVRMQPIGSHPGIAVIVNTEGNLYMDGYAYSPKEARKLALWILATFVEE